MKPTTIEAFSRLVALYVTSIEAAGADVPADVVRKLGTDPVKACEQLNELALSSGTLSREIDSAIAAIYESMDAADARSAATDEVRLALEAAYAGAHQERAVEPEPALPSEAPEPDPAAEAPSADDAVSAQASDEAVPEPDAKPKRRSRKTRTKAADAKTQPTEGEPGESAQEAGSEAPEQAGDSAQAKPTVGDAAGSAVQDAAANAPQSDAPATVSAEAAAPEATEPAASRPEATPAPTPAEATPAAATKPEAAAAAPTPAATPEPAAGAPAAPAAGAPFEGEVLTVDQTLAALGISRPTVYKLIESGKLPAYKKGRSWQISAEAVAALATQK